MADDKNEDTKEDKSSENKDQLRMIAAEERSEYFKKLEKWLHEAYAWQSMAAMFPYYLMSGQIINPSSGKIVTLLSSHEACNLQVTMNSQCSKIIL